MPKRWEVNENTERGIARALRDSDLADVEITPGEVEQARADKPLYEFIKSNMAVSAAAYIKYHQDKRKALSVD